MSGSPPSSTSNQDHQNFPAYMKYIIIGAIIACVIIFIGCICLIRCRLRKAFRKKEPSDVETSSLPDEEPATVSLQGQPRACDLSIPHKPLQEVTPTHLNRPRLPLPTPQKLQKGPLPTPQKPQKGPLTTPQNSPLSAPQRSPLPTLHNSPFPTPQQGPSIQRGNQEHQNSNTEDPDPYSEPLYDTLESEHEDWDPLYANLTSASENLSGNDFNKGGSCNLPPRTAVNADNNRPQFFNLPSRDERYEDNQPTYINTQNISSLLRVALQKQQN